MILARIAGAEAEVGYWLDPDHWGSGYGLEALRAMIDYLVRDRAITALTAQTFPTMGPRSVSWRRRDFVVSARSRIRLPARGPAPFRTVLWRPRRDWRRRVGRRGLTPMSDWSPGQYLRFGNERTRAAAELLARVAARSAARRRRCRMRSGQFDRASGAALSGG